MDSEQLTGESSFDREAILRSLPEPSEEEFELGGVEYPSGEGRPSFELFTDGGCSPNPGPGGWAFILRSAVDGGGVFEQAGAVPRSTNNRMELTAAIRGLLHLERPSNVQLIADSEYLVKGLIEWIDVWKSRGWVNSRRKPVLNEELWRVLDQLRQHHQIKAEWIKGHAGHAENERCDALVERVRSRIV